MSELTQEQQAAYDDVKSGQNCLITGPGGVGKSHLIRRIIADNPLIHVTASSGIAAVNIGGRTIHSWMGIGYGEGTVDELWKNVQKYKGILSRIRSAKCLIIDEISMLDGELFQKISELLAKARFSSKPFGGLQIILSGDFLQLPPVEKEGEQKKFVFESEAFKNGNFKIHYLQNIQRQKDAGFAVMLNEIRLGRVTDEIISFFSSRVGLEPDAAKAVVSLQTHNWQVDKINRAKLKELPGAAKKYHWFTKGDEAALRTLTANCPAPEWLELKTGATVLCLANLDVESGICNGSVGKIISFEGNYPVVKFNNGIETTIYKEKWEIKELKDGKRVTTAFVEQIPLKLGWAISIHKSQGQTLDCAKMNLENCFTYGQNYVAMSRVKSLDGIYLDAINWDKVQAHPLCVEFYEKLKK